MEDINSQDKDDLDMKLIEVEHNDGSDYEDSSDEDDILSKRKTNMVSLGSITKKKKKQVENEALEDHLKVNVLENGTIAVNSNMIDVLYK